MGDLKDTMSSTDTSPPDSPGAAQPGQSPDTAAAETGAADTQFETVIKELDDARREVTELRDKFLRAKADADNIRRRADLDVAAAHKFAIERFASEIIAVRDSLELARNVDLKSDIEVMQKMHEGLDLTLKLLDSVVQKFGITLVDPRGEKFDPARHQAISTLESAETPANHVVNVVQKGYLLHDRLLRPAMVVVAREKPAETPAPAGDGDPPGSA
jgi:molecular chaperone GrpE